jgi:hypothetical protein
MNSPVVHPVLDEHEFVEHRREQATADRQSAPESRIHSIGC